MFPAALCAAAVLALQSADSIPSSISCSVPLANDATLSISTSAAAAFEAGDQLLSSAPSQAFDAWWRALQSSSTGESVRVFGTQDAARAPTEGVECALLRRLRALDPAQRAAWRARFETLAARALAQAGDDTRALALVERNFLGTRAAVIGALRAGDGAHEAGRVVAARRWWSRAQAALALLAPGEDGLATAIASRPSASTQTQVEPADFDPRALRELFVLDLAGPDAHTGLAPEREPGAGLAELADGRIAVQVSEHFLLLDAHGAWHTVDPQRFLDQPDWSWPAAFRDLEQAWPQRPRALGNRIVAVLGRAREGHGNALACFDPGREGVAPQLIWAWTSAGWIGPHGLHETQPTVFADGAFEFEPGPLDVDGEVLVSAHRLDQRIEADLFSFDAEDGRLLWRTILGNAADPRATQRPTLPPQARSHGATAGLLAEAEGRIFVSTGLSFAALVDACDGRVAWTVRAARSANGTAVERLPQSPWIDANSSSWVWSAPESAETLLLPSTEAADALALAGARSQPKELTLASFPLVARHTAELREAFGRLVLSAADGESVSLANGEGAQAASALGPQLIALATERALYVLSNTDGRLLVRRELGGARLPIFGAGALLLTRDRLVFADPRHVRAWSLR